MGKLKTDAAPSEIHQCLERNRLDFILELPCQLITHLTESNDQLSGNDNSPVTVLEPSSQSVSIGAITAALRPRNWIPVDRLKFWFRFRRRNAGISCEFHLSLSYFVVVIGFELLVDLAASDQAFRGASDLQPLGGCLREQHSDFADDRDCQDCES